MKLPFQSTRPTQPPVQDAANSRYEHVTILRQFIQANADTLLQNLVAYTHSARLAQGHEVKSVAFELLNELTVEALEHAAQFDPQRKPMAWLLGIAQNLVKRRRVARAKRSKREPFGRDFGEVNAEQDSLSDDEVFERIAELRLPNWQQDSPENAVLSDAETARLLAPLSPEDRRVVVLAKVVGMNGDELARALGTTPTTARQRLFRALNNLRLVWNRTETAERDG